MTLVQHPKLYKKDDHENVRVWWVETDEDQYRVVYGVLDGKMVDSDWKTAVPKNVGKVNGTTGISQAISEKDSLYKKQLKQGKYHESIDDVDEDGYFEPMLATVWTNSKKKPIGKKILEDAFESKNYRIFVQPKLDGIRNITTSSEMRSRNGEKRVSCPHIHNALADFFVQHPDVILDGELYNHEYHDNFNQIQSHVLKTKPGLIDLAETAKNIKYYVYDAYILSLPTVPYNQRNILINELVGTPGIEVVKTHEVLSMEELDEIYGEILNQNYEGMVARINGSYEPGKRSKLLIKRKEFFDEEFEIVDIMEGTGNWNGKAKSVKFKLPDRDLPYDKLPESGIRGDEAEMSELLRNKGKYIGGDVTVRYPNKTPDGKPRFGVAIAFYEGKRKS